jgi:hypothetical protein
MDPRLQQVLAVRRLTLEHVLRRLCPANIGWVLMSAAPITALSPAPINGPVDHLRHVVASREHHLFELQMMLGGEQFGTFVLFRVLALGVLGLVAKALIQWMLDV